MRKVHVHVITNLILLTRTFEPITIIKRSVPFAEDILISRWFDVCSKYTQAVNRNWLAPFCAENGIETTLPLESCRSNSVKQKWIHKIYNIQCIDFTDDKMQ